MSIKDVKELKIGAVHYTVDRRTPPITECDGSTVVGRVNYNDALLIIADHLCSEVETITILHESLHALFRHAGVLNHDEQLIETLANFLFDFIRDNPDFIKAIQK